MPTKVIRNIPYNELNPHYQKALYKASDCLEKEHIEGSRYRLETHTARAVKDLLAHWQWSASIAELKEKSQKLRAEHLFGWTDHLQDDIRRVKRIMSLIQRTHIRWPYVSYWADSMEALWTDVFKNDVGEIEVMGHGDGWHRLIAGLELGRRNFNFLFFETEHVWTLKEPV